MEGKGEGNREGEEREGAGMRPPNDLLK